MPLMKNIMRKKYPAGDNVTTFFARPSRFYTGEKITAEKTDYYIILI